MQHVYQLLLPSRTKAAYCPHFAQVLVETSGRSWRGTTRRSLGGVGSSSTSQSLAVIATVPPPFGSSRVYPQTRQFPLSRGSTGLPSQAEVTQSRGKAHEHLTGLRRVQHRGRWRHPRPREVRTNVTRMTRRD